MGGLRPYYNVSMLEMKDFLTKHWQEVHAATGQSFSYDILDNVALVYDTEPPCRATAIVREIAPDKVVAFFKEIQKDFYAENKYLSKVSAYQETLEKLEISVAAFNEAFESTEWKERVKADFERARELGVSSFPTILVEINGEVSVVARGYAKSEDIIERIANQN